MILNKNIHAMNTLPVILTIAGSDCSAGAGIQTDLKTAHTLGVYALSAVTCVVAEIPGQVRGIQEMETSLVADQVRLCLDYFPVNAIKTGMLYSPPIVSVVVGELAGRDIPLVVDPVMVATAGNPLMKKDAIAVYEEELIPISMLLTPNLEEAASLLHVDAINSADQMPDAARDLSVRYKTSILLKGGHLKDECKDVLVTKQGELFEWVHPKVNAEDDFHGTGCTLSAAVTAYIAKGYGLKEAVAKGLEFIAYAIANHYKWNCSGITALNISRPF